MLTASVGVSLAVTLTFTRYESISAIVFDNDVETLIFALAVRLIEMVLS